MQIVKIKLNDLKPYENNAKIHTEEQIEQIKTSIEQFGMNDPIAIWGNDNIIVEGHGRYEALKQLGYEEVECIRLDHLTDEERKAYTLVHNKLTMNTGFDYSILDNDWDDLGKFTKSLFKDEVKVDWNDVDELEEYEEPEKIMIECPKCYHKDTKGRFKKEKL